VHNHVVLETTCVHKAFIAISAFEILDAIVSILVIGQSALTSEALPTLMAYERFLTRVAAIVSF